MSANNVFIVKEYRGKFYGWDEMAEESMADSDHVRLLDARKATVADSRQDLYHKMLEDDWFAPEYGMIDDWQGLPKDGTKIRVIGLEDAEEADQS